MEANGGDHALTNGVPHTEAAGAVGGHALPNGVPHMEAAGAVGGGGLAEHALENGGGHGLANGGGEAPGMEAVAAMEAGANGVAPAQAAGAANTPRGIRALAVLFLRFPAQEIAHFRTVCRRWRTITGEEDFRRRYGEHHHRAPMPLFGFQDPELVRANLRAVDILDRVSRPVFRFNLPRNPPEALWIHGSCRGILLVSSGLSLYACNPCTRHWGQLPPLHVDNDIVGFYVTGAYGHVNFACQVLYHDRKEDESDCAYSIFSFTTLGRTRRRIGRPGYDDAGLGLDLVLARGILPSHKIPPVFVANTLHWLPQAAMDNRNVITFDAYLKTFALIPPPPIQADVPGAEGRQLFEIDQEVAMAVVSPATVHVWVRDTVARLWNPRYRIDLPVHEIDLHDGYNEDGVLTAFVFAVAQDRNVLVQCPRILLHCDALGAVVQRYQHPQHHRTSLSMHTIEESLLLHPAILPMRNTDDDVPGYPTFLRNLLQ